MSSKKEAADGPLCYARCAPDPHCPRHFASAVRIVQTWERYGRTVSQSVRSTLTLPVVEARRWAPDALRYIQGARNAASAIFWVSGKPVKHRPNNTKKTK